LSKTVLVARKHSPLLATLALAVLSFGLAAWSSSSVFDRLPRTEDEVTFLFQAKTIAEGNLIAPGPEHKEFFFMSFVIVRDGHWFGKYPPGYPAILSLGVLVDQPWLVNAVAAMIAVGLLIVIGKRFYDLRTALLGGSLMALSPFFIIQSGSLLSHVVALCWVLLLLLLFDLMRSRDLPLAALGAGVAGGALLLTRPLTAVGIALPFAIVAAIDLGARRPLLGRYGLAFLGALPFVVVLLVYNQATTGHPFKSAYELWWPYDKIGFGPEYGVNGHSFHDAIHNMRVNLRDLAVVLFGWPRRLSFLPVVVTVCVAAWRVRLSGFSRQTTADLLLVGLVAGLVGVHMLYWTSGRMYGPRYYFEIIGVLSLLGARGIVILWDALGSLLRRLDAPLQSGRLILPALVIVFVGYSLGFTLPSEAERYRGWNGVNRADLEIVQAADLQNAVVFLPRPNWQAYAPLFLENSTTLDGDVIYAVDKGDARNPVLMRDFPGRNYYRYLDGQLIPLDAPSATARSVPRQ
jgi:4-amino-4-deoxy-L-arabinose transferase-like glycosyltransferase